jgi:eukaryotic-like serine/threonine-protein kinase
MAQDVDGRRIAGRYELGAQLGEGGVGIVWRAEDTLLGRPVAIKEVELPPAVRDKQRAALRARVIREARAAARISHPGAVTLFDVVQDNDQDYIVMELVEAPNLDQLVARQGPLEPRRAAMVGLRLLATLEAAHRAGIVHRDVKPSNVLVRDDGTTKLTDFGTASLTGDPELTVTGVVVGSPAYMAPEQIKGLVVGPATDLWALGATLYFAVEGEPPFKSSKAQFEVLNAIVNDPPRRARHLGALGPVIDRLLRKEAEQRPRSADVWYQLRRVAAMIDPADAVRNDVPAREVPDEARSGPATGARHRAAAAPAQATVAHGPGATRDQAAEGEAAPSAAAGPQAANPEAAEREAAWDADARLQAANPEGAEEEAAGPADAGPAKAPAADGWPATSGLDEGRPATTAPDDGWPATSALDGPRPVTSGADDGQPAKGAPPAAPLGGGPAEGWRRRRWRRSGS